MQKPRAYAVLRGNVTMYSVIDSHLSPDEAACWSSESGPRISLTLYSNGSIRTLGDKVLHTRRVNGRPELIVLVLSRRGMLAPGYTAVSAADWRVWHKQVQAAGDPATLPRLPRNE